MARKKKRKQQVSQRLDEMEVEVREKSKAQGIKLQDKILHPQGSDKLSERIRIIVQPYQGPAPTYDQFSSMIGFACVAWNTSLKDEAEWPFLIDEFLQETTVKGTSRKAIAELTYFLNSLIRRKLELFPDDERVIANFEVEDTLNHYHIRIASTVPVTKQG